MKKVVLVIILVFLSACSQKSPGILVNKPVWPYELYEKLNLRTFLNSYSNALHYYCASYPKDFYRPEQVSMPNGDKIVMQNADMLLSFEFVADDQVVMIEERKDGTLRNEHSFMLYYNEDVDEYRSNSFFIEAKKECLPYVIAKDKNETKTEEKQGAKK